MRDITQGILRLGDYHCAMCTSIKVSHPLMETHHVHPNLKFQHAFRSEYDREYDRDKNTKNNQVKYNEKCMVTIQYKQDVTKLNI